MAAPRERFGSWVIVKFRDSVTLPYHDEVEALLDAWHVAPWHHLKGQFPGIGIKRLFTSVDPDKIQQLIDRATQLDGTYRPSNLLAYFLIECPAGIDQDELVTHVAAWSSIETAYSYSPRADPQVDPTNDERAANQGYLDPAPDGIDAEFAWECPGGDGAGQDLIDLEQGWTLDHEDLVKHGAKVAYGTPVDTSRFHGTGVLGVACAADNTVGGVGIAPNLRSVQVVSHNGDSTANTILAAIPEFPDGGYGSVLLLEAQIPTHPVGATTWLNMPIEVEDADFAAIRLATALGIVVIEVAGNGDNDLDTFVDAKGNQLLNRGIPGVSGPGPGFRDSGAIFVTSATSTEPHEPLAFQDGVLQPLSQGGTRTGNYGSRIDCYAWGQNIDTASSRLIAGTNPPKYTTDSYTRSFSLTSGAAAIVAGAALSLQGVAQANGYRLSPRQIRTSLSDPTTGTRSNDSINDRIGVMPNLRAIIESDVIGSTVDLYVRDFVGDLGEPDPNASCASPDLIVRPSAEPSPQAAFGEGSGSENSMLGSTAESGHDNYIYVRVRNRGGADAANVTATVYWSPPATLVTPDLWTLIGSVVLNNVPAGNVLTVSDAIIWPTAQIPASGHYCFVGLVGNDDDPAPDPIGLGLLKWDEYLAFIGNNNNVAWHNFNVVDTQPIASIDPRRFVDLEFIAPGPPDQAREMSLEAVARLPRGSRAFLEMPLGMYDSLQDRPPIEIHRERRTALIPINPHGRRSLGNMLFTARSRTKLRLLVQISEERRGMPYEVFIRQMYRDREVGRITWRLAPKQRDRRSGATIELA